MALFSPPSSLLIYPEGNSQNKEKINYDAKFQSQGNFYVLLCKGKTWESVYNFSFCTKEKKKVFVQRSSSLNLLVISHHKCITSCWNQITVIITIMEL